MTDKIKLGIVFAGQGAQYPGMGKDLYDTNPAAKDIFDRAGDKIKSDCFEGDAETLKETSVTQPAVYTLDLAAFYALLEAMGDEMPEIAAVAGFSLGEYAALEAVGVLSSFEEGLELVIKRSLLMKEAGKHSDGTPRGSMAAVLGSTEGVLALVEKTKGDDVLQAVNFNCATQTVVAGDKEAIDRMAAAAKEDKSLGLKVIPLSVGGAFHSEIMQPAAEGLAEVLAKCTFSEPKYNLYINVTGDNILSSIEGEFDSLKIEEILYEQIKSPVRWQTTIENMVRDGVNTIIEMGPGKTLSGLVKKIAPEVISLHVENEETLNEVIAKLKSGEF